MEILDKIRGFESSLNQPTIFVCPTVRGFLVVGRMLRFESLGQNVPKKCLCLCAKLNLHPNRNFARTKLARTRNSSKSFESPEVGFVQSGKTSKLVNVTRSARSARSARSLARCDQATFLGSQASEFVCVFAGLAMPLAHKMPKFQANEATQQTKTQIDVTFLNGR